MVHISVLNADKVALHKSKYPICDPVMKIEYDGAIVKPKLPSNEKIRNFLIFSCMYFKFGQFEE